MFDGMHYMQHSGRGGGGGRGGGPGRGRDQEEAMQRKAMADTQLFWNLVSRNRGRRCYRSFMPPVRQREENQLFGSSTEILTGFSGEAIPVERSGPGCDTVEALDTFEAIDLPPFMARNVRLMRYEKPTPIQKHSVPLGMAGHDLMCCAQTGSGKTFAFLLPVVASFFAPEYLATSEELEAMGVVMDPEAPEGVRSQRVIDSEIDDQRGCMPRAIILAPTRELASQIAVEARKLIHNSDVKSVVVYGGADIRAQMTELSFGCDLIVATPGRLNDLVDRGVVSFCQVTHLVLDEADRMLDMGFEPQIRRIVAEYDMPPKETRQTFMFSATFADEIQSLAREFLREYAWIGVGRVGSTVEHIEQRIVEATSDPHYKLQLLMQALESVEGRTLVFVQKKRTAAWVCNCLQHQGIRAEEIHGDRSQSQRETALHRFRQGSIHVLVATDVAARGLDVPEVMHVVQFDMPISPDDFDSYVHRIGRTGRAGKSGVATSFFVPGRETGEGNGKIAPLILRLLQENNQVIPEWFEGLDDVLMGTGGQKRYTGSNGSRAQGGYYGSGGGGHGHARFGGRDVRGYQSQPAGAYGGYPGYPQGVAAGYAPPYAPQQGGYQSYGAQMGGGMAGATGYSPQGQAGMYGAAPAVQGGYPAQGSYQPYRRDGQATSPRTVPGGAAMRPGADTRSVSPRVGTGGHYGGAVGGSSGGYLEGGAARHGYMDASVAGGYGAGMVMPAGPGPQPHYFDPYATNFVPAAQAGVVVGVDTMLMPPAAADTSPSRQRYYTSSPVQVGMTGQPMMMMGGQSYGYMGQMAAAQGGMAMYGSAPATGYGGRGAGRGGRYDGGRGRSNGRGSYRAGFDGGDGTGADGGGGDGGGGGGDGGTDPAAGTS